MGGIDKVYANKLSRVDDFVFDDSVAAVFPDMARRSVPGYDTLVLLTAMIAAQSLRPNSTVYDLGCAVGTTLRSLGAHPAMPTIRFVGADNSAAMLARCRANLKNVIAPQRLRLLQCDIRDMEIADADMVILNFTLQFIAPRDRLRLLKKIYAGLNVGGVLILAEKIYREDADEENWQRAMHRQFKSANGYSELEIAQKRAALENVMVLDCARTHRARLRRAGFPRVTQWFQAFNFCSFAAVK